MTKHPTARFEGWLRRRQGIKHDAGFAAMSVRRRFLFMGLFGLETALTAFQLNRITPLLPLVIDHFDDWHVLARAPAGQLAMLGVILIYTAGLLLMGWVSWNVFRTCRDSLERELFR